jgi:hypothetical protein
MLEVYELGDMAKGQNPLALYTNNQHRVAFTTLEQAQKALVRYNEMAATAHEQVLLSENLNAAKKYLDYTDYAAIGVEALIRNGVTVNVTDDTLALIAKREEVREYIRANKQLFRQLFPKVEWESK